MRKPVFGEANFGAVVGAVVGAIGGLIALGIAPAIIDRDPGWLIRTRILSLLSWFISTPTGWVAGGQLGPRLADIFNSPAGEVVGGILGGLVPVLLLALLGWWMVTIR